MMLAVMVTFAPLFVESDFPLQPRCSFPHFSFSPTFWNSFFFFLKTRNHAMFFFHLFSSPLVFTFLVHPPWFLQRDFFLDTVSSEFECACSESSEKRLLFRVRSRSGCASASLKLLFQVVLTCPLSPLTRRVLH
jgi:hypothetical protein